MRGEKETAEIQIGLKWLFFFPIIYYMFPTAENPKPSILPEKKKKSINCPAPCLQQAGNFSASLKQNRKRKSSLLISLNSRCMWIILHSYKLGIIHSFDNLTLHHA